MQSKALKFGMATIAGERQEQCTVNTVKHRQAQAPRACLAGLTQQNLNGALLFPIAARERAASGFGVETHGDKVLHFRRLFLLADLLLLALLGVLLGPLLGSCFELFILVEVLASDNGVLGVIGLGRGEKRLDAEQSGLQSERGGPLVFEDCGGRGRGRVACEGPLRGWGRKQKEEGALSKQMAPDWEETLGCQTWVVKCILGGSKGYWLVTRMSSCRRRWAQGLRQHQSGGGRDERQEEGRTWKVPPW
jgi:hypothetical protein